MDYEKYERVKKDKYDSSMNLKVLGFPKLKQMLRLNEIFSMEDYSDSIPKGLKEILDIFEGSDAIGKLKNNLGIIGISSRVQWAHPIKESSEETTLDKGWHLNTLNKYLRDRGFKTTTIRAERLDSGAITELMKRINALLNNCSYPIYTTQLYTSNRYAYEGKGQLLSIGIHKTAELIPFITNGKQGKNKKDKSGDYYIEIAPDNGTSSFIVVKWDHYVNYYVNSNPLFLKTWPEDLVKKSPQSNLSKYFDVNSKVKLKEFL